MPHVRKMTMAPEAIQIQQDDPGLLSLALMLRLNGINNAFEQICRQRSKSASIGTMEMLSSAKRFGLSARASVTKWTQLGRHQLPAIASLNHGGYLIVGKLTEAGVLVLRPASPRPEVITRQ